MRPRLALSPAALCTSIALFATATLCATVASAQHSEAFARCTERAHGDTVQEGMCVQAELGRQDTRLNHAYQQLLAQYRTDPTRRNALRDEERTWLKRRDLDCKLDGNTVDNDCLIRRTTERADTLEATLEAKLKS